jgi:CDP-diacylglycerol--glycerol-3-phosphate 3-phosphatidyltransferase
MDRVWTLSNFLSFCRVLLVVPVWLLISSGDQVSRNLAAALILLAALTDFLDGYFARRFREVSDLGKILDPVADKIGIGIVALLLVLRGMLPVWVVVTIISRDLLILAGGLYLAKKMAVVPQSNRVGKWTAGAVALAVFASLFDYPVVEGVMPWLLAAGGILLTVSFTLYAGRFLEAFRAAPKHRPHS